MLKREYVDLCTPCVLEIEHSDLCWTGSSGFVLLDKEHVDLCTPCVLDKEHVDLWICAPLPCWDKQMNAVLCGCGTHKAERANV